jgi:hypothetical protein
VRTSPYITAAAAALSVALAACGDSSPTTTHDPREEAINACVESDPSLNRGSCTCLVDELGLTANEIEALDGLERQGVEAANAEIERILGRRRAAVLLTTTFECSDATPGERTAKPSFSCTP